MALFRRPVYCISVAFPLFDRFFNSRQGYRGAYFRSPYEGLEANGVLMRTVSAELIAADVSAGCRDALGDAFIRSHRVRGRRSGPSEMDSVPNVAENFRRRRMTARS